MTPITTHIIRAFWITFGFIFVGVGIIGYVTPGMPGLVFFLIATFCFAKGSRKFLRMLISNPYVGPQILDFKRGKGMTVKTKITAIVMMVTSMLISIFFMVKIYWVKWAIAITGAGVVILILSWKTKKESSATN